MKTHLKTFALAAVAAVSVASLSVPATAATHNDHRYERQQDRIDNRDRSVDRRIDNLEFRINQGRRTGALNRNEVNRLSNDLRDIKSLSRRYERSGRGIDRQEAAVLDRRLNALEHRLVAELRDRRNLGYRK
ncbi:MAG: hypothetical protein QM645_12310 [Asticcacaulis sp.]